MKKRLLFFEIIKQIEHKNAIVITGMRQVGKTTLMRQVYEEVAAPKLWFDFDNPLDLLLFEEKDYNNIYKHLVMEAGNPSERLFVFIDEIQNFPEITKIIKYLIDHYGVKFIITGSSNFYLRNLFPESLSGRKFLYVLYPVSFTEYLYLKGRKNLSHHVPEFNDSSLHKHEKYSFDYDQFIEFGGFPEVVITEDTATKSLILKNIFTSFFEKDLGLLSDIRDIRELRDLILLLVPRTGNILDVTKISVELGINRVKMYNYLEFLQGMFFIWLIPKFSKSVDRSVAGGKKIYFSDTGILNLIGKTNDGQLFENAIANQLIQYGQLTYYNKRNKSEIDFILNGEKAFEAKLRGNRRDLDKLKHIAGNLDITQCYLISKKYVDQPEFISPTVL